VLKVHGPQPSVETSAKPVVEAQRVQVGRRADLEDDVAGAARVRRPGRNQVEAVLFRGLRLQVALGLELPARLLGKVASASNA